MSSEENPGMVLRLGKAAYDKYWSKPVTMELHVRQLEEVYHSVLST